MTAGPSLDMLNLVNNIARQLKSSQLDSWRDLRIVVFVLVVLPDLIQNLVGRDFFIAMLFSRMHIFSCVMIPCLEKTGYFRQT